MKNRNQRGLFSKGSVEGLFRRGLVKAEMKTFLAQMSWNALCQARTLSMNQSQTKCLSLCLFLTPLILDLIEESCLTRFHNRLLIFK